MQRLLVVGFFLLSRGGALPSIRCVCEKSALVSLVINENERTQTMCGVSGERCDAVVVVPFTLLMRIWRPKDDTHVGMLWRAKRSQYIIIIFYLAIERLCTQL